jgi:hypothetical protein
MVCGMMVSGREFELEREVKQVVDFRDDVTTIRHRQRSRLPSGSPCWECTGGQKSFCMSTTRSADVFASMSVMSMSRSRRTARGPVPINRPSGECDLNAGLIKAKSEF